MGRSNRVLTTGFAMEIWPAAIDGSTSELRGRVRHLASGNAGYFRDWTGLIQFIESWMAGAASESTEDRSSQPP